jgi:hypothetical protein
MTPQAPMDLDLLADRLRDSSASLDQQVQALVDLRQGLSQLPAESTAELGEVERRWNLDRAKRIAAMTQLGDLPELATIDPLLDGETRQRLHALCAQPISREAEAEFTAALDRATGDARERARRLEEIQKQIERGRVYRDVLRDMLQLMAILAGSEGQPEAA